MTFNKFLAVAVAAGSLFAAGAANADSLVTLNPQATNGVIGQAVNASTASFQTVGFAADLLSTLNIFGTTGAATYAETGTIAVTKFLTAGNTTVLNSGVTTAYNLTASFSLSGAGAWLGNTYIASSVSSFVVDLFADDLSNGVGGAFKIGTASLNPAEITTASAILGNGGKAVTTLSATLNFTPEPGAEGVNGFFQQPTPFLIDLAVGNAGGNSQNTSYSVSGGTVTIVTGTATVNSGTANVTFVPTVPEPGALALTGLALVGLAAARRRKA